MTKEDTYIFDRKISIHINTVLSTYDTVTEILESFEYGPVWLEGASLGIARHVGGDSNIFSTAEEVADSLGNLMATDAIEDITPGEVEIISNCVQSLRHIVEMYEEDRVVS